MAHNYFNENNKQMRKDELLVEHNKVRLSDTVIRMFELMDSINLGGDLLKDREVVEWIPGNPTYRFTLHPLMLDVLAKFIAEQLKTVIEAKAMATTMGLGDDPFVVGSLAKTMHEMKNKGGSI
jgi:hypothetical protein